MQILHIATSGWSGTIKGMKTKTHTRDLKSLARRLGYSPAEMAKLAQSEARTRLSSALEVMRVESGQTQSQVAERMGVNQSTVSRIESSHWQELRLGEIDAYLKAVRRPWTDIHPLLG
jgi:DNA-binding Xre family transcriptional regulator